jgi:hypothetical protein
MNNNNGKIYFFNTSELALLMATGGIKKLYGIKMDIDNLDRKSVYETMFELQKKGILWGDGQKLSMSGEVAEVMECINNAKIMIMYVGRTTEYPQRFVYIGENAVVISPYGITGDILRLEIIDYVGIVEKICNEWFVMNQIVSDELLYTQDVVKDEILEANVNELLQKDVNTISEEQWGYASHCIRFIDIDGQQCKRQYLLMEKGLEDYIAVSNQKDSRIYKYSLKKMSEILNDDLGGLM